MEKVLKSGATINETSNSNEEEHPMEISSEVEQRVEELEWNDLDIIHMLNNGSIIAVDRSALNTVTISTSETESIYNKFFAEVLALKCKLCGYLCEDQQHMIEHLKSEHTTSKV